MIRPPTASTLFPYTTLFRSLRMRDAEWLTLALRRGSPGRDNSQAAPLRQCAIMAPTHPSDRKSTRLNSSHRCISYAVFCLKSKNNELHSAASSPAIDSFSNYETVKFFLYDDSAPDRFYALSLHDALPISSDARC